MEIEEIKKDFQKLSRQLKKNGYEGRCGMDIRQQAKRVATFRFFYIRKLDMNDEKYKTMTECYEEIIALEFVKEFCLKTKARVSLDVIKNGNYGSNCYVRFNF